MGEKKMLQKERKTCSKKKSIKAIVVPRSRSIVDETPPSWCPSLGSKRRYGQTGLGGTTKSWISSSSSACCIRQACPQLVEVNFSPEKDRGLYSWERHNFPFYMKDGAMAVTGISFPAFVFFKTAPNIIHGSWFTIDCRVTEPFSGGGGEYHQCMAFTNLIGFQRKYYAISRQGCLALLEDEGNSGIFEITAFGRDRVVPRCKVSKHFREYLLECNGEIYLVFLLSRKLINVVDGVEVFRLDRTRLSWEKMDRLKDDAMFFLQDYGCLGITASLLRCSKGGNCVYFTHGRANGAWFVYDMETSCIRPTTGPEIDLPIPRRTR